MRRIVAELRDVAYLTQVVVAVGGATGAQVQEAWEFFEDFRSPVTLLWVEDPGIQEFVRRLGQNGLPAGQDGKGRACWLSFGYLLGEKSCDVIALHDCDIVDYSREILANLCYPEAHPSLQFEFCKGFYSRAKGRLHGRVTRLFVTPLLQAMQQIAPHSGLLYIILSGEFSVASSLARRNRIPDRKSVV